MPEIFQANKHRLSYSKEGNGNHRLLFLHGLCGTKELWAKQSVYFKQDYEVLCVDLLGHGESSAISGSKLISENIAILLDFVKRQPKPTTILGHSLGGIIVNELIGRDATFENYVFIDSPCLASKERLSKYNGYHDVILAEKNPQKFFREWFENFVTEAATPEQIEIIVDQAVRREPRWMAEVMASINVPTIQEIPANSVLIMEGAQYFGVDTATSWCQFYPQADRWLYSGGGHFYFLEDPTPFNEALARFIRSEN